ncbi:MAG: hypothetical protein KatS3mg015_3212 [Fimbriimonadales bacterium]|nr:MAG: hypothetical protein KatS3mg015_3212 [Fimbriimonadales bacterium]
MTRKATWISLLALWAVSIGSPGTACACVGDCNGDAEVTIDELVSMVNIALGTQPTTACTAGDASGDGEITIEEIISAVNNALNGCPPPAGCASAIATLALAFDSNAVPNLAGVTLELRYPVQHVTLPASEIEDRVLDVSDAGGFFDAQALAADATAPERLRVSYLTLDQIQAGPLLEITFDCTSSTPPREAEFDCRVVQASDSTGFDVDGVSCQAVVDLE